MASTPPAPAVAAAYTTRRQPDKRCSSDPASMDDACPAHGCQDLLADRRDSHTHPRSLALASLQLFEWRVRSDLRTIAGLLAVSLGLGARSLSGSPQSRPPPPSLLPVLEAWTNPYTLGAGRKTGKILGQNLARQFGYVSGSATYKPLVDCDPVRLQQYCVHFRTVAATERLLFYYNGHGMPLPAAGGGVWFPQRPDEVQPAPGYVTCSEVPVQAIAGWIGSPSLCVWDCSNASRVVQAFEENASAREAAIADVCRTAARAGIQLPLRRPSPEKAAAACAKIDAALKSQRNGDTMQGHGTTPVDAALIGAALIPAEDRVDMHFAACGPDELLPSNPELPADLFTACLTTPARTAMHCWIVRNQQHNVTLDMLHKLPDTVQDRGTPIGELTWIITTVADTIAWDVLPRKQFHKLFRHDAAVAALFRNFMLADHIMRFYGVHPQSSPALPAMHKHPLWATLELEIEKCLAQVPRLLKEDGRRKRCEKQIKHFKQTIAARTNRRTSREGSSTSASSGALCDISTPDFDRPQKPRLEIAGEFGAWRCRGQTHTSNGAGHISDSSCSGDSGSDSDGIGKLWWSHSRAAAAVGYVPSTFFVSQMRAFAIWLKHTRTLITQHVSSHGPNDVPLSLSTSLPPNIEQPLELPAILQMLLSQGYRPNALGLLYQFVCLGPWAVDLTLLVGVYPYLSKMFTTRAANARALLMLIWARLVAVDPKLPRDLLKDGVLGHLVAYMADNVHVQYEQNSDNGRLGDMALASCAFTLTMMCRVKLEVRQACVESGLLDYIRQYLQRPDSGTVERAQLQMWILMLAAALWSDNRVAKYLALTAAGESRLHNNTAANASCGSSMREPHLGCVNAWTTHELLVQMALHRSPTVRAAAVYAMGTLLEDIAQLCDDQSVLTSIHKAEHQDFALLLQAASDGSPMVRREVANVIGNSVFASNMPQTIEAVARVIGEDLRRLNRQRPLAFSATGATSADLAFGQQDMSMDLLAKLYKTLLKLSIDAHPDVALVACDACDVLMQCYAHSHALTTTGPEPDASSEQQHQQMAVHVFNTPEDGPPGGSPQSTIGWLSGLDGREREDAQRRLGEIGQAWLAWGRRELRDNTCASTLLDWAGACYTEFDISLFADVSGPLQSSVALVETRERSRRACRMEANARVVYSQAGSMKWADVWTAGSVKEATTAALLHPLEPHAIVAGARGTVSVFDWEMRAQVGRYNIAPLAHCGESAAVSTMHLVNPLGQARLLVGTRDGSVRIFASHAPDFAPPAAGQPSVFPVPRLLTAFTALPWASQAAAVRYAPAAPHGVPALDRSQRLKAYQQQQQEPGAPAVSDPSVGHSPGGLAAASAGAAEDSGLVTAWNQRSGALFAGGDDKEVRVWDLAAEMCVEEIAVASMGGVTCISHDGVSGTLFAVGNADGMVRVVDRRLASRNAVVASWREHRPNAVRSVCMRPGQMEVISASENGEVKSWDLRHQESVNTLYALADSSMDHRLTWMAVHENAPLTMTASDATVRIWNKCGNNIGMATMRKNPSSMLATFAKNITGYGGEQPHATLILAAAVHTYLPVVLMVGDNGRVSCLRPKRSSK